MGSTGPGFYRGTNYSQTPYFKDKELRMIEEYNWPSIFEKNVKFNKKKIMKLQEWISKNVYDILGFEDEIVVEFVLQQLIQEADPTLLADIPIDNNKAALKRSAENGPEAEDAEDPEDEEGDTLTVDPKKLTVSLTGFMGDKAFEFVTLLWKLLLSEQTSSIQQETQELQRSKKLREAERIKQELLKIQQQSQDHKSNDGEGRSRSPSFLRRRPRSPTPPSGGYKRRRRFSRSPGRKVMWRPRSPSPGYRRPWNARPRRRRSHEDLSSDERGRSSRRSPYRYRSPNRPKRRSPSPRTSPSRYRDHSPDGFRERRGPPARDVGPSLERPPHDRRPSPERRLSLEKAGERSRGRGPSRESSLDRRRSRELSRERVSSRDHYPSREGPINGGRREGSVDRWRRDRRYSPRPPSRLSPPIEKSKYKASKESLSPSEKTIEPNRTTVSPLRSSREVSGDSPRASRMRDTSPLVRRWNSPGRGGISPSRDSPREASGGRERSPRPRRRELVSPRREGDSPRRDSSPQREVREDHGRDENVREGAGRDSRESAYHDSFSPARDQSPFRGRSRRTESPPRKSYGASPYKGRGGSPYKGRGTSPYKGRGVSPFKGRSKQRDYYSGVRRSGGGEFYSGGRRRVSDSPPAQQRYPRCYMDEEDDSPQPERTSSEERLRRRALRELKARKMG